MSLDLDGDHGFNVDGGDIVMRDEDAEHIDVSLHEQTSLGGSDLPCSAPAEARPRVPLQ